jgi:hypothetical protein
MNRPERKHSPIRPLDSEGPWTVNDWRYFDYAKLSLKELLAIKAEIDSAWPVPLGQSVRQNSLSPKLRELLQKRDLLSDSVPIFSAMCVESFINFYGVLRLGEIEFHKNFERMGLSNKLEVLLLVCDSISLSKKDPLVVLLTRMSERRNTLAHPKTREVKSLEWADRGPEVKIPDAAQEAVADLETFFHEFILAIPGIAHHVPPAVGRA